MFGHDGEYLTGTYLKGWESDWTLNKCAAFDRLRL